MSRNKTSFVVLVILAGIFVIAIAMVFNTSVRRENALKRQASVNEKIEFLNSIDLTVYWIGGFPSELEKLRQNTNVIMPENISRDNMPVKSSTFRISITEKIGDHKGDTKEIVPRKYSEYMMIVLTSTEGISDEDIASCVAADEVLAKHADWVDAFKGNYECIDESNVDEIIKDEIGHVFMRVLEDAGVFKRDAKGQEAFDRFIASL